MTFSAGPPLEVKPGFHCHVACVGDHGPPLKLFCVRNMNCRRAPLGPRAFPVSLDTSKIVLLLYLSAWVKNGT